MPNNKVIVIDDDPSVLRGITRVLKMSGFDPVPFDCAESFENTKENEEGILEACCLVLDIHLKGKSGLELKRALGDELPVIFITASDSDAIAMYTGSSQPADASACSAVAASARRRSSAMV